MEKVIGLHISFFFLKLSKGTMRFIGGNLEREKKVKVFFFFFPLSHRFVFFVMRFQWV